MAIFSFRPAPGAHRRSSAGDAPADWAETRPSSLPDSEEALVRAGAFRTDPELGPRALPRSRARGAGERVSDRAGERAGDRAGVFASSASSSPPPEITAAFGQTGAPPPDPGFAQSLTARAQNDDLLGAGWYISSWDLMQGCDVIEGTPIDQLPPEWQRKRPRL